MINVNKMMLVGSLVLAVAIPLTTWLAVRNQENRSKAASSESDEVATSLISTGETGVGGVCGEIAGQVVDTIPSNNLACLKGAVNWMDSTAADGSYNWDCVGMKGETIAHCEVLKH